jgi:hypothetical protein
MDLPPGCRLTMAEPPAAADCKAIEDALTGFNKVPLRDPGWAHIAFLVRNDAGALRAGLDAEIYAGWLFIRNLWVEADLRRRGVVGRQIKLDPWRQ